MKDINSLNFVKKLFFDKFEVGCNEISRQDNKTPDFFLYKNNQVFAVAELKNMSDDENDGTWKIEKNADGLESYEKCVADFPAGKVAKKISGAYVQLKIYDKLPKVLIFLNYWSANISDLQEALTGGILYSEGSFLKYPRAKVLEERIGKIKQDIDLYIWIDKESVGKENKLYFKYYNNETGKNLRQYFV